MYLGRVVEIAAAEEIFRSPQHPYTVGLLEAAPRPDPLLRHRTPAIRGDIPSPFDIPSGCRFRTRCRFAEERCVRDDPALLTAEPSHQVACHVLPFKTASDVHV
jgi:oligopeptide/dipeptide ABC transporter ATP-binding protein